MTTQVNQSNLCNESSQRTHTNITDNIHHVELGQNNPVKKSNE